jgi:hypothetical protein
MALIECPECNKQISDQAAACPGCGACPPKEPKSYAWLWSAIVVIGGFLVYAAVSGNDPAVQAMRQDRDAYKYCLQTATASAGNPIAKQACEQMRLSFRAKYNREP